MIRAVINEIMIGELEKKLIEWNISSYSILLVQQIGKRA